MPGGRTAQPGAGRAGANPGGRHLGAKLGLSTSLLAAKTPAPVWLCVCPVERFWGDLGTRPEGSDGDLGLTPCPLCS